MRLRICQPIYLRRGLLGAETAHLILAMWGRCAVHLLGQFNAILTQKNGALIA